MQTLKKSPLIEDNKLPVKESKNSLRNLLIACAIFLITLLFFSSSLGSYPFYTHGESREALVVKAILDQDNPILPLRNGDGIPSKPPMYHWMSAAFAGVLGHSDELTIRFPSALCSALALAASFLFFTSLSSVRIGLYTILILMTSFEWARSSSHARVDMCFTLWTTLSLVTLYLNIKRWKDDKKLSWTWLSVTALSLAFAILSKGPAGFLFPVTIAGLYALIINRRPLGQLLRSIPIFKLFITLAIPVLIAGTWYFLAYRQGGSDFARVHFLRENVSRFMETTEDAGHIKPFYFGIIMLFLGFLPWGLYFPVLAIWLKKKIKPLKLTDSKGLIFSLVWVGIILLVVTIAKSKREVYLLPAYPALAYLIALSLDEIFSSNARSKLFERVIGSLLCVIATALIAVVVITGFPNLFELTKGANFFVNQSRSSIDVLNILSELHQSSLMLGFLVLTAIFFGCSGFNLMFGRYKKSFGAFFCAVAIVLASVSDFFLPTLARSRSPEAFASRALEASESHHLYFYKEVQYALAYYVGKDVPFVNSLDEIRQRDGAQKETLIFVRLDHLKDLGDDVNKLDVLLGGDVWRADGKHPIGLYKLED